MSMTPENGNSHPRLEKLLELLAAEQIKTEKEIRRLGRYVRMIVSEDR